MSASVHSLCPQTPHALIENLRKLMQQNNLNEAELSRKTQLPQATVHKILSGKTEDPRASTLKILSDFFGVSIDGLLSKNIDPRASANAIPAVQSLPVISWQECIYGEQFIAKLNAKNWNNWIVAECISKNAYALSSKPCLSPRFPKNTILFIDPDIAPRDGDFVVVKYANTEEATLREFSVDGPSQLLLPVNLNAEASKIDKQVKILGVLIKSSFSY